MPSITNGTLTANFSISSKNSSGNFTISATISNASGGGVRNNVRLTCSLNNSSGWQQINVGQLGSGKSGSGSTTFSTGNTGSQQVYCYLVYGESGATGPGGAYTVGGYNPPSPTYYDHTLSFYGNGGDNVPSPLTVRNTSSGSFSATIPDVTPTRDNFVFLGWSAIETSTSAEYQPNTQYTFNSANVNLYAVWYAQRQLDITYSGNGVVLVNGTPLNDIENTTLPYGQNIEIVAIVEASSDYLSEITKNDEVITNEPSLEAYTFAFRLEEDTDIVITFATRQSHTLSVISTYSVQGTGTYKYLDKPILLANLNGLVNFQGWFENDTFISSANPLTYDMPNRDVVLNIKTNGEVFTNYPVRQFALQNGLGEVYKLTDTNSKIFLDTPTNLGLSKRVSTNRLGNSEIVANEVYNMPQPQGQLVFHNDRSGNYKDYYDFVRFASKKPISLWYKIPTNQVPNNIFHIPVEIMSIDKNEVNENGLLIVPISFYGLNFWQITQTQVSQTTESVEIYNDSDFNVGIEIEARKLTSQAFSNPKILFKQDGEEYGAMAINYENITAIKINTRDKGQIITLYNGEEVITNPFAYIDFSYADGVKDFPFPKLKQGYTTIELTYDNMGDSEQKIYSINFDKEYLSV